jgi:hypothetical protein
MRHSDSTENQIAHLPHPHPHSHPIIILYLAFIFTTLKRQLMVGFLHCHYMVPTLLSVVASMDIP